MEIKYADQMTKHCWKHGIGSVDKECCGLVGYRSQEQMIILFLMRCRVLLSLEQWKEGWAWISGCKCWEKVLAHPLVCFVLITCSDLSPAFSVEPAMRKGMKHSHVVYVESPREAHTALQKAWGLVTWVSWCWMIGWPENKSLLVFRNIWGYMFFL